MKAFDIFVENQLNIDNVKPLIMEANIARKLLTDPKRTKMMAIAINHDWTFPKHEVAGLGDKAEQKALVELWGRLVDRALATNPDGDLSRDGSFDDWLVNLYINGHATYEEIVGESGDAMGLWKRLGTMVKREPNRPDPENPRRTIFGNALVDANGNNIPVLDPRDRDLNNFKSLAAFRHRILQNREYAQILQDLKKQRKQEKMQADPITVTLIDNDQFLVTGLFNYGATHQFARGLGDVLGQYCTGFDSESGAEYADTYTKKGLVVGIIAKNADRLSPNRKFQMLAADGQLRNAPQDPSRTHESDQLFASLYPGLMKQIAAAIQQHADEIVEKSAGIVEGGYNIPDQITAIQQNFPLSYASEAPAAPAEQPQGENDE